MSNVDEIISLVLKEPKQDGGDFSGSDLKGVSLNGASFVFATLMGTVMEEAELRDILTVMSRKPQMKFLAERVASMTPRQPIAPSPQLRDPRAAL